MGTSTVDDILNAPEKDHPHACGDKTFNPLFGTDKTGSSPRVWGQVDNFAYDISGERIIPTRVGTS